jgi:hypothetical protein
MSGKKITELWASEFLFVQPICVGGAIFASQVLLISMLDPCAS